MTLEAASEARNMTTNPQPSDFAAPANPANSAPIGGLAGNSGAGTVSTPARATDSAPKTPGAGENTAKTGGGHDTSAASSRLDAALAEAAALPLRLTKGLAKLLLLSPLALIIALLAAVGWWYERDAHQRQAGELTELKKETQAQVSKLQAAAEAATRQANQTNAQQIRDLEAQRDSLERNAETLQQQLALLGDKERSQVEQVATLPAPEVAHDVATALGLGPHDLGTADAGSRTETGPQSVASGSPAAAGATAGSALASGGAGANASPAYQVSEQGLQKMDTALIELQSCQKQAVIRDQQATNCQQQQAASQAIISQQKDSIDKLNTALADKDQILAREQQSEKEEMKMVRGTFTGRALKVAEHVAVGVAIGLALHH